MNMLLCHFFIWSLSGFFVMTSLFVFFIRRADGVHFALREKKQQELPSVTKMSLGLLPRAIFETLGKYFYIWTSKPVNNIYLLTKCEVCICLRFWGKVASSSFSCLFLRCFWLFVFGGCHGLFFYVNSKSPACSTTKHGPQIDQSYCVIPLEVALAI